MGFTLSEVGSNQSSSGGPVTLSIAVSAGAAIGVIAIMVGTSGYTYAGGTISDTGGNSYISAGGGASTVPLAGEYSEALYCLNAGASATSVSYTPPTSYTTLYTTKLFVWVWTVTGGTPALGSESHNFQASPGTGTDALTSGAVTCAAGSVIMGCSYTADGDTLSAGTGFTYDTLQFGAYGEHGAFSGSHAATFTDTSGGTSSAITEAISFGISSAPSGSSSQFFFGASMLPLAWVIRRRQQRAKERSRALRSWKRDGQSGLLLPEYRHAA